MITDDVLLLFAQKKKLRMILLGHVDSGKSTLLGRLLVASGEVTAKEFEVIKSSVGRGSFCYAYMTDVLQEERYRGISKLLPAQGSFLFSVCMH